MDCSTLIEQIKNKYIKMVKVAENPDFDINPSKEYLEATSNFLGWFEELIFNATVEKGDSVVSAKTCIIDYISGENAQEECPEIFEALSLFSDKRIYEIFGVKIFSD